MTDLENIKKHYGEKFAHFCRDNFSTILEKPGVLYKIISEHFAPTHSLYENLTSIHEYGDECCWDIIFVEYIHQLVDPLFKPKIVKTNKTPFELMDEAGYVLYPECQCENDIQAFKKYYAKGEELCTFKGGRLNECRVWFAVKKNVNKIKRENFSNPQRQDEYGTSVISIQISENGLLSIKNRYNHAVKKYNPDATFSNNLDNIIPGLTHSFKTHFNIEEIKSTTSFDYFYPYMLAGDNRFYRYNIETDNIYYCENNIVIHNGRPEKLNTSRYTLMDNYILDKQKKCFIKIDDGEPDGFIATIPKIAKIEELNRQDKSKMVVITPVEGKKIYIGLNKHSEITQYINENVVKIPDNFMLRNLALNCISIPNARVIGDNFLNDNEELTSIYLPHVKFIGKSFCACNQNLKAFIAPEVVTIDEDILLYNKVIEKVYTPKLSYVDPAHWKPAEFEHVYRRNSKIIDILENTNNKPTIHL